MRQAGVIAAAGLYALENNVERLPEDHANAERLAKGLRELARRSAANTNMVLVEFPKKPRHWRSTSRAETWCCRARRCAW